MESAFDCHSRRRGSDYVCTLLGVGLSQAWGWSISAGIVLGLAISIASTVVLLRGLMDNGLLNTPHGQAAVGWLVLEDLATVLILVLMPSLANTTGQFDWQQLGLTLLKAGAFIALAVLSGTRFIPWLLLRIAHTRSRELFILSILTISLGTALGAAEIFGVSLALGAFVAGVVVSESPLSHQVGQISFLSARLLRFCSLFPSACWSTLPTCSPTSVRSGAHRPDRYREAANHDFVGIGFPLGGPHRAGGGCRVESDR